jgi:uncharacterized protein HemX
MAAQDEAAAAAAAVSLHAIAYSDTDEIKQADSTMGASAQQAEAGCASGVAQTAAAAKVWLVAANAPGGYALQQLQVMEQKHQSQQQQQQQQWRQQCCCGVDASRLCLYVSWLEASFAWTAW